MKCLPSLSSKVAEPPSSCRIASAASIRCSHDFLSPRPHATPQHAGPLHAYPRPVRPAPPCARTPTTPDRAAPHKPWGKFVRIARSVRRVHVAFGTPAGFQSAGRTVAFQTQKMSANRVIGELECGCQLIHGLFACPQLLKNSTPRAFQQSLSPTSVLHSETVRPAASKSKL